MSANSRRAIILFFTAGLVLAAGVEATLRINGLGNFPVFLANDALGYIPAPSQHGEILRNKWFFNSDSMGVGEDFSPSQTNDVLLIGDSLIYGGLSVDQTERLGPLIQQYSGDRIWPVGAPSWSLVTELLYIKQNPHVSDHIDTFVFLIKSDDLGPPSRWTSDGTHPRHRPILVSLYLAQKISGLDIPHAPVGPSQGLSVVDEWMDFRRDYKTRTVVVLLPSRSEREAPNSWAEFREKVAFLDGHGVEVVDAFSAVSTDSYKDDIHLNSVGNRQLAAFIRQSVSPVK